MSSIVLFPATYDSTSLVEVDSGTSMVRQAIGLVRGFDDTPEVRGSDTVIPGATGMVPRDRVWDHRTIELDGFIGGVGATEAEQAVDLRSLLEEYRALFDPTKSPATLTIGLEDGGTASISARPLNMMCPVDGPTMRARVNVVLLAVDGEWEVNPGGSGS